MTNSHPHPGIGPVLAVGVNSGFSSTGAVTVVRDGFDESVTTDAVGVGVGVATIVEPVCAISVLGWAGGVIGAGVVAPQGVRSELTTIVRSIGFPAARPRRLDVPALSRHALPPATAPPPKS